MGFKMKIPCIFLAVLIQIYGPRECSGFNIIEIISFTGASVGSDMEVTFDVSLYSDPGSPPALLPSCIYDMGNGEIAQYELLNANNGTYTTTTPSSGYLTVLATCVIEDNYVTETNTFYAGNAITGLSATLGLNDVIIPVPTPVIADVVLPITFFSGTDVNVVATIVSTDTDKTMDGFNESFTNNLTLPMAEFQVSGMYTILIVATNPLSTKNITVVLAVIEAIDVTSVAFTPTSYAENPTYVMATESFNIATTFKGEDVVLTYEIIREDVTENTTIDIPGYYCAGVVQTHTMNYLLNATGTYYISLTFSNVISEYKHPLITVISYYEVNGFSLTVTDETTLISNAITFDITVDAGAYYPMGTVNCTFSYDNGVTDVYNFDYTTSLTPLTYSQSYTYPIIGHYVAVVKCANELPDLVNDVTPSYQDFPTYMIVLNPVANLVLNDNSPNRSHHPFSKALEFTIALTTPTTDPQLPNITCSADFSSAADPIINITGDATSDSNVILVKPSFSEGEVSYTVTINCSNELMSQVIPSITYDVYYDCWLNKYFDATFRNPDTPFIAYTDTFYTVEAIVTPANVSVCVAPLVLEWKIYDDFDNPFTPVSPFNMSTFPTFGLPPHKFENRKYKFELTTTFIGTTATPTPPSMTDFCYLRFDLPSLRPKITDAEGLVNPITTTFRAAQIVINSEESYDPAVNTAAPQPWLTSLPLTKTWTCQKGTTATTDTEVLTYISSGILPAGVTDCPSTALPGGINKDKYEFAPNSNVFELGVWYIYKMQYARPNRSTDAIQALKVLQKPPLSLEILCLQNCYASSSMKKKLRMADLQLNIAIRTVDANNDSATYIWKVHVLNGTQTTDITHLITGSKTGTGFIIPKTIFGDRPPGTTFQVSCTVNLGDGEYAVTTEYQLFVSNYPPYGGNCTLDRLNATAEVDTVCVHCTNYKDEGHNLERSSLDEGGAMTYDVVQRYVDANGKINTTLLEVLLKTGTNSRQCVKLRLPDHNLNITMVEVRVKDYLATPFTRTQFNMTINPPIAPDATGPDGATAVSSLVETALSGVNGALDIGDISSVTLAIGSVASCLQMGGTEPVVNMLPESDPNTGGLGDKAADGSFLSVEEAFNDLEKPELDETTIAIRTAKSSIAEVLASNQDKMTDEMKTEPLVQMSILSSAKVIVSGSEHGLDENVLSVVGNVVSHALNHMEEMAKKSADSAEFTDFITECIDTLGSLSAAVSNNDAKDFRGIETLEQARYNSETQFDFASDAIKSDIDDAQLSEDERIFLSYKSQLKIQMNTERRQELGSDQSVRIDTFLDTLMRNVIPCDGAIQHYGDHDGSKAISTTTRIVPGQDVELKLEGNQAAVTLPNTSRETDGKINIGLFESATVVSTDESGQYARISSKEVHLQVQMQANIDGLIRVEFKVAATAFQVVTPLIFLEDADKLFRQKTFVNSPYDMFCIVQRPLSSRIEGYKVWISCNGEVSKLNFDAEQTLSEANNWTHCFMPTTLSLEAAGICYYGTETFFKATDVTSRKKRAALNTTTEEYPPMNSTVATMACMVLDENKEWRSDTCDGQWLPDEGKLLCDCAPAKKMTFANSFYVPPNSIDFSSVFLKFSPLNQAAVMGVLAGVFIIYVLIAIWARRKDKRDLLKWGITPMADNFAEDNYFYVIKVFTGLRPGAGTMSKVGMVIAGEEMDSGVRELSDGVRKEFTTGSVMNFLMSTTVHLGDLEYIRVWHDNSGPGNKASWYLSKMEVQDVQRNETFSFLAERWLAVEKGDGMLECVLPVCKRENLNVFKNRFYMNAKESLAESHIWVSVVYRPVTSHFTRVQRATCALVFIMLTMIANAMFFKGSDNYETPASVQVGPFRFEMQQIYISIICALITTPATLVVIYLFKLAKPKPPVDKPMFSVKPDRSQRYKIPLVETWFEKQQRKSMELEQSLVSKGYPQMQGFSLPYWVAYVAWFIAFVAWFLSGFFIMLYSMEWGKQKSEDWVTTFLLSFFESIFCLDPIKVAVMALVFAVVIRSAQETPNVIDRSTIMRKYKSHLRGKSGGVRIPAPPLDTEKLQKVRATRTIELQMNTAVKDIILNVFLIWILFSLSFSTRDIWSYNMHQETVENLLSPPNQMSFYEVKTINDYFDWLNNTAIMNLFPEEDSTGERLHWRMRQFMQDGAKLRVGPPRLRQLRTTERECDLPYFGREDCYKKYYEPTEDTGKYCIGWNSSLPCDPEEKVYKYSSDAWQFTSAFDIWGFPITGYYTTYGGGGYISKLAVNRDVSHLIVDELYKNSWVDRQTRAVIFEFTLYNLNTNIFTYNVFMAEFPETGGVFPYVMILPLRVYMHNGALGMYTLLCEIIFLIYLVFYTVVTIILMVQQKKAFFKKPWQVYDLVFLVISYLSMIMYFVRNVMTSHSLSLFKEDQKAFVNFYHIALWDQIFVLMIGLLVYMAVLRMLNVFGYNKRIGAVCRVFTNAATELLWFGIFFLNVFMCYAVFGFLLFGSKLKSYKDVYKTMGTLFISMIGKSRFTEIEDADPMMSKIYFMIFIFFVVYMILTMFLCVLSKSIDEVNEESKKGKGDELVNYVLNKFKDVLSNNGTSSETKGPRGLGAQGLPPAPWSTNPKRRWNDVDHRAILEDIRQSLNDAIILDPEGMQKKAGFGLTKKST